MSQNLTIKIQIKHAGAWICEFSKNVEICSQSKFVKDKTVHVARDQCDFLLGGKYSNIFKLFIWIFFLRFVI